MPINWIDATRAGSCARVFLVAFVVLSVPAICQGQERRTVVLSLNAGYAIPATDTFDQVATLAWRQETARYRSVYFNERGGTFDLSGVVLFGTLGAGAAVTRTTSSEHAGISLSIPSPFRFNAPGTAASLTEGAFGRDERALHLHAVYSPQLGDRLSILLFGGPTFFSLGQDVVTDIDYTEDTLPSIGLFDVNIVRYNSDSAAANGWGVHVGTDVAVFLTEHFGVGGILRWSRGTVPLTNGLRSAFEGEDIDDDQDVGAMVVSGGVRFRF